LPPLPPLFPSTTLFRSPTRWRVSVLQRAYEHSATMRPALICALMVGVIGMLVNDSGVVILSVSLSLATPLMLAAGVRSLELDLRSEEHTSELQSRENLV